MNKPAVTLASLAALTVMIFSVGCGSSTHPNQLNAFDGDAYDTLLTSRAALVTLSAKVKTQYPKYTNAMNTAIASYNAAFASYSTFRTTPTAGTAELATQIGQVTVAIVQLETQIQQDMKPSAEVVMQANLKYGNLRNKYSAHSTAHISVADILTELEIAAAVAQAIPQASPYAALAQFVIEATSQAVAAMQSASGRLIDLSQIGPIALLPVTAGA